MFYFLIFFIVDFALATRLRREILELCWPSVQWPWGRCFIFSLRSSSSCLVRFISNERGELAKYYGHPTVGRFFFFDPLCRQLLRLGNCAVVVASGPAAAAPEDFSFIFSLSAVGLHSLSHSPPIEKSVDQRRFISSGRPSSRFMLWCRLHLYAQANATPVG